MTAPSAGPDDGFVLEILAGRCRAQAVSTAAALGIADRLAAGPKSVEALAGEIDCDAGALGRLMGVLTSLGLCERTADHAFVLTRHGEALRSDALGPLAAFLGTPEMWDPWSRLRDTLRAGSPNAFERVFGTDLYDHLRRFPAAARAYDDAIDAFTRHEAQALCERFDFSEVRTVVDVGGGRGTSLLALLERWPHLRGMLVDLPHVVERTRARFAEELPGRVEVLEGDFLVSLPGGADAYVLKHVLHNWDDARAGALLRRCAEAMDAGGRVLVIEAILAPDDRGDAARLLDLEMLVLTGGRERRKPELRRLFHGAGLALDRVEPLTSSSWLLVGTRHS